MSGNQSRHLKSVSVSLSPVYSGTVQQYGSNECFFFSSQRVLYGIRCCPKCSRSIWITGFILFSPFFLFFFLFFLKGLFTQCSSLSSEVFAVLIRITYTDALFVPFNMKISCRIHFSKKKKKKRQQYCKRHV